MATGCNKELTQTPYNALPPEVVLKDEAGFQYAVNGVYKQMTNASGYYGGGDGFSFVVSNDILADNAIPFSQSRGTGQTFANWTYTPLSTTSFFQQGYGIVRAANEIINNIDNLPNSTAKSDYLAQALAMRAVVHFDMVRLFGVRYTATPGANDFGIPYVKTVPNYTESPKRDDIKTVYDNIVADLTQAASLVDPSVSTASATTNGRISLAGINGYLARAYFYRGEYDKAITAASAALGGSPNVGSYADFPKIWTDATNNGVLFKLKILDVDKINIGTVLGQANKPEQVPTLDFYNLYTATDIRRPTYFKDSVYNSISNKLVVKYLGKGGTGTLNLNDVKLMRVADVLLIRAESYARTSQPVLALADLNTLRAQRYSDYVPGTETGTALLNAIQLQRRLEMAFEGDRFVDLKRQDVPIARSSATSGYSVNQVRSWPSTALSMPVDSHLWALPIDQNSINASKGNLQNYGY
ncbi:RagB/SusD family nutrient uptake outer membrane protein [Chitinophaga parva]